MERQEMYAALFSQLAAMLHFAAMQQMGKVKNPMTGTIERNLEGARHTDRHARHAAGAHPRQPYAGGGPVPPADAAGAEAELR